MGGLMQHQDYDVVERAVVRGERLALRRRGTEYVVIPLALRSENGREVIDARNQLDGLVYQTEKTLGEHGAALDPQTKAGIESALADAKKALESQDAAQIRASADTLARASHKLAEAMYAKASTGQQGGGPQAGPGAGAGDGGTAEGQDKGKEDVVEAGPEEVKE